MRPEVPKKKLGGGDHLPPLSKAWMTSTPLGAFHLGKMRGNFGGSKSGISDW